MNDKMKTADKAEEALMILRINGFVAESEVAKIRKRIAKSVGVNPNKLRGYY